MKGPATELLVRGLHAVRRSAMWWTVGTLAFTVLNVAFWPSLKDSAALQGLEDMGDLLEAFGAQNLTSPAGYLDGQLFALMLPLLLSGMAVAHASLLTAGDEDAGRLELLHALPIGRRAIWLSRWMSALSALVIVALVVAGAVVACLPIFSFDGVPISRVLIATAGCALLAAFHASVAYAVAGLGGSRARSVGAAIVVLVVGYVVSFVLPLADALKGARNWSPWFWAIGEQPVYEGVKGFGLLALAVVTAVLVVIGTFAVERRDIRSA